MTSSGLQQLKKGLAALDQIRELRLNHRPHELVADGDIIVAEFVAKADDFRTLDDGSKEFWVSLAELFQCFTDDDELAFYGRTDQTVAAVLIEVDVGHSSLNSLASLKDIGQIGPGIPGQGPAS